MVERLDQLGFAQPEHHLWPACQWGEIDPTKPLRKWDTAWRSLRTKAGLPGLRFHDLRHTVITELAEMGVPDHVLESISGHLSRRMLEHYSHVRIEAKRKALEALDQQRQNDQQQSDQSGGAGEDQAPPAVNQPRQIAASTSQAPSQSVWAGSVERGKLLIPLARRDVRVVEGARLESVCRGNSTVGSNPTLSARTFLYESLCTVRSSLRRCLLFTNRNRRVIFEETDVRAVQPFVARQADAKELTRKRLERP